MLQLNSDLWEGLLLHNTRLMLSMTQKEAIARGFSQGWYHWTIANAMPEDRTRLVRRILNPRNHPLDVQVILARKIWTKKALDMLQPINLDDPGYDGRSFNTTYLGVVQLHQNHLELYYGSGTGKRGEHGRLSEHEDHLSMTLDELLAMRQSKGTSALYFHEVALLPGAEHKFHAIHRFPKLIRHQSASAWSQLLALICEQFNLTISGP